MSRTLGLILCLMIGLSAGCAGPTPIDPAHEPALARIAAQYAAVVEDLHQSETDWYSGWTGNVRVNLAGESVGARGLCYQWQEAVYAGTVDTVRAVGWEAALVAVNEGIFLEHHAVIVFDPARAARDTLLQASPPEAYVLDAWRRGAPEVFALRDWLPRASGPLVSARLEEDPDQSVAGTASTIP